MTGPAPGDWPLETLQAQAQPLFPGLRVEAVAQTDSTNTELMRRARAGAVPPATLLVAETQTAGRGRLGRSWVTDSAGPGRLPALTFSLGVVLAPQDWSGLSLAVGVALVMRERPRVPVRRTLYCSAFGAPGQRSANVGSAPSYKNV